MLMATQSSYSPTISGVLSFFSSRYDQVSQDLDWGIFFWKKILWRPMGPASLAQIAFIQCTSLSELLVHHITELFYRRPFSQPLGSSGKV